MTPAAREVWLAKATDALRPVFAQLGNELPAKLRVSCSWPSKGGCGTAKRVVGQCWSPDASADGVTEVFVSPTLDDREEVLVVLVHELLHAAVGLAEGHKGLFKQLHPKLGLTGKCTASEAGEDWLARYSAVYQACGDYPHAKLDPSKAGTKKQSTRQKKLQCDRCDYVVRASRKCIERGLPTCPCGGTLTPETADIGDEVAA